jgi:hypothetical protein
LAKFRTQSTEKIGERFEFQTASSELKGAFIQQKAVIATLLSQTITAICTDFGYAYGVAAALAAVVCWKRSPN